MEEQLNLGEYTYKQGVKVEIEGAILISLLNHLNMVANEETKVTFPVGEDGIPDVQKPNTHTSALGATSIGILPSLEQAHMEAIQAGKATHVSEIQQRPDFTEVKDGEPEADTKLELEVDENTQEEPKEEKKAKKTMKVTSSK
jgi:hypothetical protein